MTLADARMASCKGPRSIASAAAVRASISAGASIGVPGVGEGGGKRDENGSAGREADALALRAEVLRLWAENEDLMLRREELAKCLEARESPPQTGAQTWWHRWLRWR